MPHFDLFEPDSEVTNLVVLEVITCAAETTGH